MTATTGKAQPDREAERLSQCQKELAALKLIAPAQHQALSQEFGCVALTAAS